MKLYDSLRRETELLPEQKKLRMFVCGPTVYDYSHIGHARTYIFFDFLAKYLRSQGYEVNYLQNITDIDDKIIKRAAEEHKTPEALAAFFTEAYLEDMAALGIDSVTNYAPATKFISQIVAQVERLIDKGFAYQIEGDGWYFDISKDGDYGKLSGRTAEQAEDATSRIDESVGKRNRGDFCLWKFFVDGEPSWPSSIGAGRPGWHIEDTAISEFFFGPQYEVHGGGVDLKFPHHEAEIAQQESASGRKPFVQYWLHTGALLVEGKKMSKSLGNFITIRDFLEKYPADVLRLLVLMHHYRSPMDYSNEAAAQAEINLERIKKFLAKLAFSIENGSGDFDYDAGALLDETETAFEEALADDLNTATALARLMLVISETQPNVFTMKTEGLEKIKIYLQKKFAALGLTFETPQIPQEIKEKLAAYAQSRANQQFTQSDALRQELNALGYEVEDTPKGPFLWPRKNQT